MPKMLLFVKPSGGGGGSGGGSGSGSSGEGIGDLPVTSSLRLWLKADAGVTLSGLDVTGWLDQSGTGNTLSLDLNGSGYPQFKANGINGKPCVYFNNTKSFIKDNVNLADWTVIHVSRLYNDPDGVGRIFSNRGASNNILVGAWDNRDDAMYVGSNWVFQGSNTNYIWKISVGTCSSGANQSYFYQNGQQLAGPVSLSQTLNGFAIGGGWRDDYPERAICDVSEVLVYDRVLTTQERQQLEAYLNAKYAVYEETVPALGLQLWLKADAGVTTSGSNVTQWNDQSGNSRNFMPDSGSEPVLAQNSVNGRPAINLANQKYLTSSFQGITFTSQTVFTVFRYTSNITTYGRVFTQSNSIDGDWQLSGNYIPLLRNQGNQSMSTYMTFNQWANGVSTSNDTWYLSTTRHTGSSVSVKLNNTANTPFSHNFNSTISRFRLGASYFDGGGSPNDYFNSSIAEVLVYNRDLTSQERQKVETYLNNKYAVYEVVPALGLEVWLKSDDGVVQDGSGNVTQWQDRSGNSRHFLKNVANTGYPSFSQGAVLFTSSQTYGDVNASILSLPSESLNLTTPYTLFCVVRAGPENSCVFSKSNNDAKRRKYQISINNGTVYSLEGNGDISIPYNTGTGNDLNVKRMIVSQYPSDNYGVLRYNGAEVATGNQGYSVSSTNSAPIFIGASPFQAGSGYNAEASREMYVYEILFYSRALTSQEIQQVETYLNAKYSIY